MRLASSLFSGSLSKSINGEIVYVDVVYVEMVLVIFVFNKQGLGIM